MAWARVDIGLCYIHLPMALSSRGFKRNQWSICIRETEVLQTQDSVLRVTLTTLSYKEIYRRRKLWKVSSQGWAFYDNRLIKLRKTTKIFIRDSQDPTEIRTGYLQTEIVPVLLYGYETSPFELKEGHGMKTEGWEWVLTIQVCVFWVEMTRSVAVGYQHFGAPCCLHIQSDLGSILHHLENVKSRIRVLGGIYGPRGERKQQEDGENWVMRRSVFSLFFFFFFVYCSRN